MWGDGMSPFSPAYTPVLSVRDLKPGRNGGPKPNPYDSDNARVRMNGSYLPKQEQPVKNITKPSQM
jgi:hypothetical protein